MNPFPERPLSFIFMNYSSSHKRYGHPRILVHSVTLPFLLSRLAADFYPKMFMNKLCCRMVRIGKKDDNILLVVIFIMFSIPAKYIRDGLNIMKAGNARVKEHPKTIFQIQRIVVQNKHSYVVMVYIFEKNNQQHLIR